MDETINDRVKTMLHERRMTSSEFSRVIDISRSTLSAILNGKARPSYEVLTKIADAFPDISLEWLILGKGQMHSTPSLRPIAGSLVVEGPSEADFLNQRIVELERERDMAQAQVELLKEMMMKSLRQTQPS